MLCMSGILLALWLVQTGVLFVVRRRRMAGSGAWCADGSLTTHDFALRHRRMYRLVSYGLLAVAVAFAAVSVWRHDYRLGVAPREPLDWRTLVAWNNEMIEAHGRGDLAKAERIARRILSEPEWRGFIPANAVMGSALAQAGDYAAAAAFFKAALSGRGAAAPQPAVMNDYADTLWHLGRYDEAEVFARRAVAESGGKTDLYKLTLAQILRDAGKDLGEMKPVLARYAGGDTPVGAGH